MIISFSCSRKEDLKDIGEQDYLNGTVASKIDPSETDDDGDNLSMRDEISLGTSDSVVNMPIIRPISVLSELKIHKSQKDYYRIVSNSKSFDEEIRTRIYSKILVDDFKMEVQRDYDIEDYMFSSISLLELSLKDRVEILEYLSSGQITGSQFKFDISLEINSYDFIEKIDSIVAQISLLDRVSGDIEKITDFTLRSPTGGELIILDRFNGNLVLNVDTSIPTLLLRNEVLENISNGNKEIIFSINSFRYSFSGRTLSSNEVESSVLAKNSRFIYFDKNKLSSTFVPIGKSVKEALSRINYNYEALNTGEIVSLNNKKSSNITSVNPDLLKDYEYDRTSWYGIGNKNNINDVISSDNQLHGLFYATNIDLMNGHRTKFEYDLSASSKINLSLYRNDKAILEFSKKNTIRNRVEVDYKYQCCNLGGRNDVMRCFSHNGRTVKVNTAFDYSVDPIVLKNELSGIYINDIEIDLNKMITDGAAYLSKDKTKFYIELNATSSNLLNFDIKDEDQNFLDFNLGHRGAIPSCDSGGVDRVKRFRSKQNEKQYNLKATVFGITTLDRN